MRKTVIQFEELQQMNVLDLPHLATPSRLIPLRKSENRDRGR